MSPTATSVPARVNWEAMWPRTDSETAIGVGHGAGQDEQHEGDRRDRRRTAGALKRAQRESSAAATAPAGTHTTMSRSSGWSSERASCCSGSAPETCGPDAQRLEVAERVQPARRGDDDERDGERAGRSARRMTAKALTTLVALLVLAGPPWCLVVRSRLLSLSRIPPPRDPAGVTAGRLLRSRFHSPALRGEHEYDLYLPPGYAAAAAAGQRFPVVYLLHGAPGWPQRFTDAGDIGVRSTR